MLGELLGENTGKRIVRRVLGTNPPKVEVSFEDSGTMLGVATNGFGTYTSVVRADGSILGDGQGIMSTADGELIVVDGLGTGEIWTGRLHKLPRHIVFSNGIAKACAIELGAGRLRIRN